MTDDFGSELEVRSSTTPRISYVNEAGVSEDVIEQVALSDDVASAITNWVKQSQGNSRIRSYDVFNRSRYRGENHIFAQMALCAAAVEEDDVLSTLADALEGMVFQRMRFEMDDEDQEDVWNQIAADINFDARLKQIHRELFKTSHAYVGIWWQRKTYRVRTPSLKEGDVDEKTGKRAEQTKGNRNRKKEFDIVAPTALTIFDPTKILPVGNLMFGRERFAYIANENEHRMFQEVEIGARLDRTVMQLIEGRYEPNDDEKQIFGDLGIDFKRLWLMRSDSIFRLTATKADYERFSPVRLKTILELIDMKSHLRASDRAALIGSTNFIVVITKGSDKFPARQAEIDNLNEQAKVVARMPILVGDHRLNVEIVTPKLDHTLQTEKYWALDSRIVFRAIQSITPSQQSWAQHSAGSNVSETSRVVTLGLESRRHAMMRTMQRTLFQFAMEKNPEQLTERPSISFSPKRVSLDLDPQFINMIMQLRDRGDMSRETLLEEVDYDQGTEARRRLKEREVFDAVFQTAVPFSSPEANPFTNGREGGRPPGSQDDPQKVE